jgi:AcrR family transcriptional regulator
MGSVGADAIGMSGGTEESQAHAGGRRQPTRRYEARRREVIASAVEELNRKGVRGMTLGDVAARLDIVSTGVIYYFKNKEELAEAAFLAAIGRFEALIAEAMTAATPRARLEQFLESYFTFKRRAALGQDDQIAVFNDVRALNSAVVNDAYVAMFRHARRLLDVAPDGKLSPSHRNARAHLLLSEVFWSVVWLSNFACEDYGRAAVRLGSIASDGLAAAPGRWVEPEPLDLGEESYGKGGSSELFLRAATKLINAEGYHGASVERISAELNVSKGAFYHHNETKDDLVVACFRRTFDIMWRAIRAAETQTTSGLQAVAAICSTLVAHQFGGAAPLLRTSALTTLPEALQSRLIADFDRLSLRFASILCDGIADGSVRPIDVNVGAQMITGMINAAAELHFWAPGLSAETVSRHYVAPLFHGLLSRPAD